MWGIVVQNRSKNNSIAKSQKGKTENLET